MRYYSLNNKIASSLGKEKLLSFVFSFFINIWNIIKSLNFYLVIFLYQKNYKF